MGYYGGRRPYSGSPIVGFLGAIVFLIFDIFLMNFANSNHLPWLSMICLLGLVVMPVIGMSVALTIHESIKSSQEEKQKYELKWKDHVQREEQEMVRQEQEIQRLPAKAGRLG